MKPKVLVLTGYGINTDYETAHGFTLAGAEVERVHLKDLILNKRKLSSYQIFALPGGFSFGDDIAAGKVLANKLLYLTEELLRFIEEGKLIIGICNGFQALVKAGLLPGFGRKQKQEVTLTYNDSGRFEDRWVYLRVNRSKCVFTQGLEKLYLPIRCGEGKFVPKDDEVLERLITSGQVVLQYIDESGNEAVYPWNPTGSVANIAGICDPTGRIFGLMPHPEAFLYKVNHPRWRRERLPKEGQGLLIFRNAVKYICRRWDLNPHELLAH